MTDPTDALPAAPPAAERDAPLLQLQLENRRDQLGAAQQQLAAFLVQHRVGQKAMFASELVLEELLANFVSHAFDEGRAHQMQLQVRLLPDAIELRFIDDGRSFDPTVQPEPARPASIDEARPGGLGLMLVRRWSRSFHYRRDAGRNHVSVEIANPAAAG